MKNTLKCNITGTERVTNVPYLNKKADRLGITVEEYKANYVSKAALGNLKTDIEQSSIEEVASKLGTNVDQVTNYINFNGKNKFVPTMVSTDSVSSTEEDTTDEPTLAVAG